MRQVFESAREMAGGRPVEMAFCGKAANGGGMLWS